MQRTTHTNDSTPLRFRARSRQAQPIGLKTAVAIAIIPNSIRSKYKVWLKVLAKYEAF